MRSQDNKVNGAAEFFAPCNLILCVLPELQAAASEQVSNRDNTHTTHTHTHTHTHQSLSPDFALHATTKSPWTQVRSCPFHSGKRPPPMKAAGRAAQSVATHFWWTLTWNNAQLNRSWLEKGAHGFRKSRSAGSRVYTCLHTLVIVMVEMFFFLHLGCSSCILRCSKSVRDVPFHMADRLSLHSSV